ncbi:SIMPL domain-containing protein [Desulforhopalus vacuolatus]|uniref:SIMPL domain-containing protein n=1 Tax=Desulforhopalus vacuolatus TaxID=40414 RepID=UPI001964462A|nr:SIMPL domain-containing protein [Desulforhopalus vacuolatus]MBM9519607.1 SIMPL domain-containing protein [Desulforhopalus vacuolatus]
MKRILTLCIVAVLGLVSVNSFAESAVPQISVFGVSEKSVVPDEMHWNLQVNTRGASVEEVASAHLNDVSDVLSLLDEMKISEAKTVTSRMQIRENWQYQNNSRVRDGYIAGTQIFFVMKDFKKYVPIWTKLSTFKNLQIENVNFALSTQGNIQNELQIFALRNAKKRAERLAAVLGVRIGTPLLIEVNVSPSTLNNRMAPMLVGNASSDSSEKVVAPGEQQVRSSVHVVFSLETISGTE